VVSITPRPRFTPEERTPGTHCTGGWVGPRAGLDVKARGKILCLCRGSNPSRPVRSQTQNWLSYPSSSYPLVGSLKVATNITTTIINITMRYLDIDVFSLKEVVLKIIIWSWRNFKNKELHDVYVPPNDFEWPKKRRWDGMDIRNACTTSVGNSERNRPLGLSRPRWDGNIKTDLKETGYGQDSTGLESGPTGRACEHSHEH
jgi:hypothetical protein